MTMLEATIEEFEQGAWVANLVTTDPFSGTFTLQDGTTWIGAKVSESVDRGRYFTLVVGGANGLGKKVADQYYSGRVSIQAAVQQICTSVGEIFGGAQPGEFLSTYVRILGTAAEALNAIADAFTAIWWIGRDGQLQLRAARPPAATATGVQDINSADVDGSVELLNPQGVVLGALYGQTTPQTIRHIRWRMSPDRFSARVFFVPFIFRPPTQNKYAALYNARVDSDNGDGTLNVIADARFGVTKVPLFCGVPGSKVKMLPGEQVTLGFFGNDPQKPFCVAMAQDTNVSPTKKTARNGDSVQITITPANVLTMALTSSAGPVTAGAPVTVDGMITSGSSRLLIGDA
jgi:hypothetical protein